MVPINLAPSTSLSSARHIPLAYAPTASNPVYTLDHLLETLPGDLQVREPMKIVRQPFPVVLPHPALTLLLQPQRQHAPVVAARIVLGGDNIRAWEIGQGRSQEREVPWGGRVGGEAERVGGADEVLGADE